VHFKEYKHGDGERYFEILPDNTLSQVTTSTPVLLVVRTPLSKPYLKKGIHKICYLTSILEALELTFLSMLFRLQLGTSVTFVCHVEGFYRVMVMQCCFCNMTLS
jgi:hypothetical protein